jgi:hypothetical protein
VHGWNLITRFWEEGKRREEKKEKNGISHVKNRN